ncbi:tyramine oxidase, partial [Solicola sp. PLA-1-18]
MSTTLDTRTAPHPLARLTREEIEHNRRVLDEAGLVTPTTRFPLVLLDEPAKADVLAWDDERPLDRRTRSLLLDRATGDVTEVLVSLTAGEVVSSRAVDVVAEGQPPIMGEEFDLVEQI